MTEIKALKVYDIEESIIASGLAMKVDPFDYQEEIKDSDKWNKHLNRCINLVKSSKNTDVHCHDNFLTGIRVSFDIKYPQYLSPEMQRYHFFDIITSMSKMHRLCRMDIRESTNKYVSPNAIKAAQEAVDDYNKILCDSSITTFSYWDTNTGFNKWITVDGRDKALYSAFIVMLSSCPLGLELWMRASTNYKQLQTIYYQRRHHRLQEDWGVIINMIENLPYFKEFILCTENSPSSSIISSGQTDTQ